MARIRKLVLDVLKPHHPNALTFATSLADLGTDYKVRLTVNEVDEKTETTTLVLEGQDIAFEAIIEAIVKEYKGKIVLVVGHSDTLPELMANMGASKNVPPIAENEYDNIYVVSIPWFGKTKTIRLRYGEPYLP